MIPDLWRRKTGSKYVGHASPSAEWRPSGSRVPEDFLRRARGCLLRATLAASGLRGLLEFRKEPALVLSQDIDLPWVSRTVL